MNQTLLQRNETPIEGRISRFILDELNWPDKYEMYKLIYSPAAFPVEHCRVAMIEAGNGILWGEDVYLVILDLTPEQRKDLWKHMLSKIDHATRRETDQPKINEADLEMRIQGS